MASTFTPNLQIEEPARGDDVGVWDVPVNSNMTLLDLVLGGIATIPLNNANVTLSAGQFQSKTITFNSTLTGSVRITFPSTFIKSYEIQNLCTGSSAFNVILTTTASSGGFIAVPPGQIVDVLNDGVNIKFKNLPPIGTYVNYASANLPLWVQGCGTSGQGNIPLPYLECNGGGFNTSFYPVLATMFAALPDARGRTFYSLDEGTNRVTVAQSGVNGGTLFAGGGDQLSQSHAHGVSDPGHPHTATLNQTVVISGTGGNGIGGGGSFGLPNGTGITVNPNVTGVTVNVALAGGNQNMPPLLVGGITMIRAG